VLDKYKDEICSFNDDIQGTGAVALAALNSACAITGSELKQQQIVIFGAGTAGVGIAGQLHAALVRAGLSEQEAYSHFWLIDRHGLLQENVDELLDFQKPFAKSADDLKQVKLSAADNIPLEAVIKAVKPTVLIGTSAVQGAFNEKAVKLMYKYCKQPIILPLSNPTERSEAIPSDLLEWTNANALIATGSPFSPVIHKKKKFPIAQCNNALIFPGIAVGILAIKADRLTDNMIWAAVAALTNNSPASADNPTAPLLPRLEDAKHVAREVAVALALQAVHDGVTHLDEKLNEEELIKIIKASIDHHYWEPRYLNIRPE